MVQSTAVTSGHGAAQAAGPRTRPVPARPGDLRRDQAHRARPGRRDQVTDAIALMIAEGHPVHVVVHRGGRHDLGNPGGFLRAAVDFALQDPEYGPELRVWLRGRVEE